MLEIGALIGVPHARYGKMLSIKCGARSALIVPQPSGKWEAQCFRYGKSGSYKNVVADQPLDAIEAAIKELTGPEPR